MPYSPLIAGQLPIPKPGELSDPKLELFVLPSMEPDMTFIMTSIMRNITPNMSSIAAAGVGNGRERTQTINTMARCFFMLNTFFQQTAVLKFSKLPEL
jgi:hypothetical protein